MKLNAFTDYALRVLIFVAARPAQRATIAEIAQSFAISEHHLGKVVHFLGKGGWLANRRGHGGGLELALPAAQIAVGRIVRAAEGAAEPAACFAGGACSIAPVCRLRDVLGDATAAFYAVLDRCSLADLVHNRAALAPLLYLESAIP